MEFHGAKAPCPEDTLGKEAAELFEAEGDFLEGFDERVRIGLGPFLSPKTCECIIFDAISLHMSDTQKRVRACFYSSENGQEPVRDWLQTLSKRDKKAIGTDIMTVEYGWPIGMPTCRALGGGLFETRTRLENRIARLLFCFEGGQLVLLHGFI